MYKCLAAVSKCTVHEWGDFEMHVVLEPWMMFTILIIIVYKFWQGLVDMHVTDVSTTNH